MGFYVSQTTRRVFEPLIPHFESSLLNGKELIYASSNPVDLANRIRNALGSGEFPNLRGNFRISHKKGFVVCTPRTYGNDPTLVESTDQRFVGDNGDLEEFRKSLSGNNRHTEKEDFQDSGIPIFPDSIDFFGIIQYLITKSPDSISFPMGRISDKEFGRLQKFSSSSGFKFEPEGLIFTKTQ